MGLGLHPQLGPSLKWLSSYLKATELHYVMYWLRQDRRDVTEINLIFLKLASDYDLNPVRIYVLQNSISSTVWYAFISW